MASLNSFKKVALVVILCKNFLTGHLCLLSHIMKLLKLLNICLLCLACLQATAKKNDSLDYKIGQMIMIGIGERTALSTADTLAQELQAGKIGGVVLFEKNIAKTNSKDSLKMLVQSLQKNARTPLFVSIDEEGGKVHRLKEKYGFIGMPSAAYLGKLNNTDSTLYYNRQLTALLKELGINLNYAPTLDLGINPENTVIFKNNRSFGADYKEVAKHAGLCIKAHHENGIKTSLKHFPGHGSSMGDTHLGIVDVSKTWDIQELLPYQELFKTTDVDAVMIGHMVNEKWDASMLPATLSKPTIDMLKNLLGFKGVVVSDDMQMHAIAHNYGLENAIMMSINAGMDIIMFANTIPEKEKRVSATQIHAIVKKLVKKKKISKKRIDEAYRNIMALKNKQF